MHHFLKILCDWAEHKRIGKVLFPEKMPCGSMQHTLTCDKRTIECKNKIKRSSQQSNDAKDEKYGYRMDATHVILRICVNPQARTYPLPPVTPWVCPLPATSSPCTGRSHFVQVTAAQWTVKRPPWRGHWQWSWAPSWEQGCHGRISSHWCRIWAAQHKKTMKLEWETKYGKPEQQG